MVPESSVHDVDRTEEDRQCLPGYLDLAQTHSQHTKVQKRVMQKTGLAGLVLTD